MIILHVIVGLETGGAENMLLRLVSSLPRHKHIIVSLTNIGLIGHRLIDCGFTVHALDLRFLSLFKSLLNLWRLVKKYRPDVIQTWMYHSDLLGGLIGRVAGVKKIVWNVRNTEIPQRQWSVTGVVIKLCAVLSHFVPNVIICCAHASIKSHVLLGYCRERMIYIPNGYDPHAWALPSENKSDLRKSYGMSRDLVIIGIVGRYNWLKGYDVFIEAASLLSERCSRSILFVMVGRNVDVKNTELLSLIAEKGGLAQFKLMGERNDIPQILSALDVFCLASRAEGFPNVVAEAMLMRVPCVVTDVGDAALIVGATGKVVPPNQPSSLAEALLAMENMIESQRLKLGCEARERILSEFDIYSVADRYENVYLNGICCDEF